MSMTFSRRNLLKASSLAVAVGFVGSSISACSTGPTGSTSGGNTVKLPTFKDFSAVKPDLVSAKEGMPGFLKYPAKPVASVSKTPLSGGSVTALTYSFDPVAPGLDSNPLWQAVNESLGGKLDIVYTPYADYGQKFATTIAGGSLPDLVAVRQPVQQLPALLQSKFVDLTDHLSGDAVLEYPNLAGLPTVSWAESVVNNRIWGVPMPRPAIGAAVIVRQDLFDKYSVTTAPKDFKEFKEVLVGLTNDREGRWALGDFVGAFDFLRSTHGIPGPWIEKDGKLTSEYELPEYEQSLAQTRELVELGVMHPNMVGSSNTQRNDWFLNGAAPIAAIGFTGWSKYTQWGKAVPGFKFTGMLPFSNDGTVKPAHMGAAVAPHFTAITKADEPRVKELLRVLDWLAAPFGSAEYTLRNFGVEGKTFALEGTNPVVNSAGQNQKLVPFKYVTDSSQVIFQPLDEGDAKRQFEYQEQALALVTPDPLAGLYSETEAAKSSQLASKAAEVRADIILGRKPVSAWKDFVTTWKADGGDKIRDEFQKGLEEKKV
ncbi:extracellular solute-binding protein [Paenarthrobacter sp. AMU7]|uniref:Extracellular solute-binding protein n=1 Tax=Paenarthrobacter sp. AMU7 TaxID=3162492 RepID=A0AB39YN66_9MICC